MVTIKRYSDLRSEEGPTDATIFMPFLLNPTIYSVVSSHNARSVKNVT